MKSSSFAPAICAMVDRRTTDVSRALRAAIRGESGGSTGDCDDTDLSMETFIKESSAGWSEKWSQIEQLEKSFFHRYEVEEHNTLELENSTKETTNMIIVCLGAGFDSRCSKINRKNYNVRWIRVDRAQCIAENERQFCALRGCGCIHITGDAAAESTYRSVEREVRKLIAPDSVVCWIAEGLLEYLSIEKQERVVKYICETQRRLGCNGHCILALLGRGIDGVCGARFGWKFVDPANLAAKIDADESCVKRCSWGFLLSSVWTY
eukprot:g114.t1